MRDKSSHCSSRQHLAKGVTSNRAIYRSVWLEIWRCILQVGTPVVTIHGSCPRSTTHNYSSASASPAADLAAWMPAVQRHMDASGVVPQLAVSQGHLSPVSSLLASTCDYNFTQHGSRSGCRAAEICIQDCRSAPESGSCSGCRAAEHSEQHDSCSSSNSSSLCCKQELSQQVSAASRSIL